MNRKQLFFLISCIAVLLLSYFAISKWSSPYTESKPPLQKGPFFATVPITGFSSIQCPWVDVQIDNQALTMEIDSGFQGGLRLDGDHLHQIHPKTFIGKRSTYGFRGNKHTVDLYSIPDVRIGSAIFRKCVAEEEDPEFRKHSVFFSNGESCCRAPGRLGWELFRTLNLLLDVKNEKLAFCDSVETLKKEGYPVEKFAKTKLLLDRQLLEIEAMTSSGLLRCMLDTGSTLNMLNRELMEGETMYQLFWDPENKTEFSSLEVGGVDLGPISFYNFPVRLPIHIEATLGEEFFEDHIVFIDFREEQVYIMPYEAE